MDVKENIRSGKRSFSWRALAASPSLDGSALSRCEPVFGDPSPERMEEFRLRYADGGTLLQTLGEAWFEAYLLRRIDETEGEDAAYFFALADDFLTELKDLKIPSGIFPSTCEYWRKAQDEAPETPEAIASWILSADPASPGAVLKIEKRKLLPAKLETLHQPKDFFSFYGVRGAFSEAMHDFALGKSNVPLLISSLPGHGKTQLTLAYAAAEKSLCIVLPPPSFLSRDLESLFNDLKRRRGRRFVVFFDDIDPNTLDWFEFKNLVGGIYSPPENVLLCISSNYQFPPSIVSRGRLIEFPMFDEVRCCEMVEDFLISCNMRKPPKNLVSLIAADYTENFGQKRFSELSPRTLSRYLRTYRTDAKLRRRMLELSTGELITRPDAQLFYDFNIRILRSLYGSEYIENLKQQRLRELER